MNNEIFQKVFNKLIDTLPLNWDKMIFYVAYMTGSYSMKYYSKQKNGEYVDCFNLETINRAELLKLFVELDGLLSEERSNLEDKDLWTVFTMVVDSDGKMKADFDYEDISTNSIDYEKLWKSKYLTF